MKLGKRRPPLDPNYLPHVTTIHDLAEAQQARLDSRAAFMEAVDKGAEVRQTADKLRRRRIANGFGDLLDESMHLRGKHP